MPPLMPANLIAQAPLSGNSHAIPVLPGNPEMENLSRIAKNLSERCKNGNVRIEAGHAKMNRIFGKKLQSITTADGTFRAFLKEQSDNVKGSYKEFHKASFYEFSDKNNWKGLVEYPQVARLRVVIDSKETRIRLEREFEIHKKLSGHPNIVKFIDDISTPESTPNGDVEKVYLFEELYEMTLDDYSRILTVESQKTRQIRILGIIEQILKGLQHIHHQGYVHNNIKPHSIMVNIKALGTSFHQPKVAINNFVCAELIEGFSCENFTPRYVSPEVVFGDRIGLNHVIPTKSDMWSLGITLYLLMNWGIDVVPLFTYFMEEMVMIRSHQRMLMTINESVDASLGNVSTQPFLDQINQMRFDNGETRGLMRAFRGVLETLDEKIKRNPEIKNETNFPLLISSICGMRTFLEKQSSEKTKMCFDYMDQMDVPSPSDKPLEYLIHRMLQADPRRRISVDEALQFISEIRGGKSYAEPFPISFVGETRCSNSTGSE